MAVYDEVAKPSAEVDGMSDDWQLASDLIGGTKTMRAAGNKHLPKWPNEDKDSYETRLKTATLYPAFQQTVETLTGKPFSKPVTYGPDIPSQLKQWCQDDVDLEGRNLDVFASDVMEAALGLGLTGILVDYPTVTGATTVEEERAQNPRPYMVHVSALCVLGWMAERQNGEWSLTQLRLKETVDAPDPTNQFATVKVVQVRVLKPGEWELWRERKIEGQTETEWYLFQSGIFSLNYIPFVPIYGKRLGFMMGKPPMLELAYLNVKHWQSQSDQDTLLHIARVPILVRTGIQDIVNPDGTFYKPKLVIGAAAAVDLPEGATLSYCEHTGEAISAGKTSLDDLKEEMRQSGAEMLVVKQGNQTTRIEAASDNLKGMCALQRVTLGVQDGINLALQYMADWAKLGEGGHIQIFRDFAAASLDDASAQLVLSMQQAGILSKETTFHEEQRRGVLSAEIDYEEEKSRVQSDGPPLGTLVARPAATPPTPARTAA